MKHFRSSLRCIWIALLMTVSQSMLAATESTRLAILADKEAVNVGDLLLSELAIKFWV